MMDTSRKSCALKWITTVAFIGLKTLHISDNDYE